MIPVILYVDKIQMSISGKFSLFSVPMSLSIFTEAIHCILCYAWCPLGFIAPADYFFSPLRGMAMTPMQRTKHFHTNMQAILKAYKDAQ